MITPINQMFHPSQKDAIAQVADARKRVASILYLRDEGHYSTNDTLAMLGNLGTAELVKLTQDARDGKIQ
jgi:hypothetical protein